MEPIGSLPSSQEPSTDPDQSSPYHPILSKIHFNIIHPCSLGFASGLFHSGFPAKILYAFHLAHMRATCPAHLILVYLIILIIFGEK
jgi:hypothetical protein